MFMRPQVKDSSCSSQSIIGASIEGGCDIFSQVASNETVIKA